MKIDTKAVHHGDRKRPGSSVPSTTPIYTASSYFYEEMAQLDRVFAQEEAGESYARYSTPNNNALEEVMTSLEGGHGALACASGMSALHIAIQAVLMDRRRSVVASNGLYGATVSLLLKVFEPFGVSVRFVDMCDTAAVEQAVADEKPGCLLVETVSNPLMRVAPLDHLAVLARQANAALIVDNTFATPVLVRPLELGAHLVVHSATKYIGGHGDVLGGVVVSDADHFELLRSLSRIHGPVLGPFESYLALRGIKTLALRMERHCRNACQIAAWLASHSRVERVNFPGNGGHPDTAPVRRLFPADMNGAMLSFELKGAGRAEVFAWMDRLKLVVRSTSLGDVHTMTLYPAMSSHREISPKQRERMGIGDNLIRISAGIEAPEDILADLQHAFEA